MNQKIKTNIKFYKGLNGVESKLYGLVTKSNGSWRGCREEDACKKKIVFIDSSLEEEVIPGALYKCTLTPMHKDGGFIAKSVKLVKFKAVIDTEWNNKTYEVRVKFGNKLFIYNPSSPDHYKNNIKEIADVLRTRVDLEDANNVAEEFIDSACIIKRLYEQDIAVKNYRKQNKI